MLPRIQCSIEQGSKFSVKGDLYVERKKKKRHCYKYQVLYCMSRQRQGNESSIIFSEGENKSGVYILPESQRYGYENISAGSFAFYTCNCL